MEGAFICEYKKLVDELSGGMEKAKQLQQHLSFMYPCETDAFLLQRIISSFENALLILSCNPPSATVAADQSPRSSDNCKPTLRDDAASKKRKLMGGTRTERVRVDSKNGLEGPSADGYSWRKYGQKDILGAKYPRSYYRCTYRLLRSCWAMKQVQRSDDDPAVFEVTYKGAHSCHQEQNPVTKPRSQTQNDKHGGVQQPNDQILLNMKSSLRVDTQTLFNVGAQDSFPSSAFGSLDGGMNRYSPIPALVDDSGMNSYSSPMFHSPVTPDSEAIHQMRNYAGTQVPKTASPHASSESMIFSIDDDLPLESNFLFDITELLQ